MSKAAPVATVSDRHTVRDRRLNDPFGVPTIPIQFKDPSLLARWFPGAISNDKVWMAKQVQGWDLVMPAMLVDLDQIGGHDISPSGNITRGERGQEVLMCMPRDAYDKIQWAKARKNLAGFARTKAEVIEAAGNKFGDEAADFLNRHVGPVGGVSDNYERIERKPLDSE